jgi:enoyl-CoA hydratase/carnithine racemase
MSDRIDADTALRLGLVESVVEAVCAAARSRRRSTASSWPIAATISSGRALKRWAPSCSCTHSVARSASA